MKFDLDKAIKKYNEIMYTIAYEHCQINTRYSENTEGWNIRDMVAECDYALSTYYEQGHSNHEMIRGDEDEKKMWRQETGYLKRFIIKYEPFIEGVKCVARHCSKYDN